MLTKHDAAIAQVRVSTPTHYMRFRDQMKVGADGQQRLRLVRSEARLAS
jgi:hypothetical protein